MKRRALAYVLTGIILFPLFLAATAPASWVAWGLNRLSDGYAQLDGASGYLWAGDGTLVFSLGRERPFALGRLGWELDPWSLLHGRLSLRINGGDARTHLQGEIDLAPGQLVVRDVLVRFPAELVTAFYPPAVLFDPGGNVAVTAASLGVRRDRLEGQATMAWDGAAARFSAVRPLGDYRLYLDGHGEIVMLRVETADGALAVTGAGRWQLDTGEARFDGTAFAAARHAELEPLLRLIGRDQGGGRRVFTLAGKLPAP